MNDAILNHCYRALDLIEEFIEHKKQKEHLFSELKGIEKEYHKKNIDYVTYEKQRNKLLGLQSKSDWKEFYSSCLTTLLNKIAFFNQQIVYQTLSDNPFGDSVPPHATVPSPRNSPSVARKKKVANKSTPVKKAVPKSAPQEEPKAVVAQKKSAIKEDEIAPKKPVPALEPLVLSTAEEKKSEKKQKSNDEDKEITAESFEELFHELEE